MDAHLIEFRRVFEELLREDSLEYERRLRRWSSVEAPRDDIEEYVLSKVVDLSFEVDHARRAQLEGIRRDLEKTLEDEIQSVHELGRRLFFDRSGPAVLHGLSPFEFGTVTTSWSGLAVDPDDPATLVRSLEKTGTGCRWLREQWTALQPRVAPGSFCQAIDRFKMIRLLSRQPIDSGEDRTIAELHIACFALNPVRGNAWIDLRSDLTDDALQKFKKRVRARWSDMISADQTERAHQMLGDLVEQNITRLNAKIEELDAQKRERAERLVNELSSDGGRQGAGKGLYFTKCLRELWRCFQMYQKIRNRKRGAQRGADLGCDPAESPSGIASPAHSPTGIASATQCPSGIASATQSTTGIASPTHSPTGIASATQCPTGVGSATPSGGTLPAGVDAKLWGLSKKEKRKARQELKRHAYDRQVALAKEMINPGTELDQVIMDLLKNSPAAIDIFRRYLAIAEGASGEEQGAESQLNTPRGLRPELYDAAP